MKNVWQSGESTGALDEKKRLCNICSRFSSIKAKDWKRPCKKAGLQQPLPRARDKSKADYL